jgi:hypothetical protein
MNALNIREAEGLLEGNGILDGTAIEDDSAFIFAVWCTVFLA